MDSVGIDLGTHSILVAVPDAQGNPVLHLHMACGRKSSTRTGCIRRGVKVWHTMEVVLFELLESKGKREIDPGTGFTLLKL